MTKRSAQDLFMNEKQVCCIRLCNEPTIVEHDGIICARMVGLDFGEDVVQQVVVLYFGVQVGGAIPSN